MKRVITGLILIGIGIATITLGGPFLFVWLLIVSLLITYELLKLLKNEEYTPNTLLSYAGTAAIMILAFQTQFQHYWDTLPAMILVGGCLTCFLLELLQKKVHFPKNSLLLALRIILVSGGALSFVYLMRQHPNGLFNTWFCFIVVWSGDICALYGGRKFGKHSLSAISPKKTIEGTIFGILGSMSCALIFSIWFSLNIGFFVVVAAAISMIGLLGDLHESLTKRHLKTKDSSSLLPGHGGFYDRADSTLFVFPLFFFILS